MLALAPDHVGVEQSRLFVVAEQRYAPAIADLERTLALAPDLPTQGAVLHLKNVRRRLGRL